MRIVIGLLAALCTLLMLLLFGLTGLSLLGWVVSDDIGPFLAFLGSACLVGLIAGALWFTLVLSIRKDAGTPID